LRGGHAVVMSGFRLKVPPTADKPSVSPPKGYRDARWRGSSVIRWLVVYHLLVEC